jgi:hypothetical protein
MSVTSKGGLVRIGIVLDLGPNGQFRLFAEEPSDF